MNEQPRQGSAAPADAALDPAARLPENLRYRGEALFQIAHTRDSLMSLWSALQAHEHSAEEP